jgi:hypothetical protein
MIRHAKKIGRDGIVGTDPSMISGRQGDIKMLGVGDISMTASTIFPISREKDLSYAEIRLVIHLGATATRLVGEPLTEQSVAVN